MTNFIRHSYNGAIISQDVDGYVSLTDMAKAHNKLVADYLRNSTTEAKLKILSSSTNLPVSVLVRIVKGGSGKQGTWAHPEIAIDFAQWCKSSRNKKTTKTGEISVRNRIAAQLKGRIEVPCKTGFVDVLTQKEIIEVKAIKNWKDAIGQVLVYACEFPDKTPRIHLFGDASTEYKHMITSFCFQLNVIATFED